MSRYASVNAPNRRAAVVAVTLIKAVRRPSRALKEFLLPCEEDRQEGITLQVLTKVVRGALSALKESLLLEETGGEGMTMTLQVLTKAVRRASSGLEVILLPREENGQEHMVLPRSHAQTYWFVYSVLRWIFVFICLAEYASILKPIPLNRQPSDHKNSLLKQ